MYWLLGELRESYNKKANGKSEEEIFVYVIELDKKVESFRKIRQANPQRLSNKPCVYIGQSYYLPEIRFEQHKEGYRSNKYAKEYGVALKPELYDKYNPIPTRKDAEKTVHRNHLVQF